MKPRQHTVFSRLVRTQISIIVIFVGIILALYMGVSLFRARKQLDRDSEQTLSAFAAEMDESVFSFSDQFILNFILSNKELTRPFRLAQETLTMNQVSALCDALHTYLFTNTLFHSIYVDYKSAETIVSTNGVYFYQNGSHREDIAWLCDLSFSGQVSWLLMEDYRIHYTLPDSYADSVISLVRKYPFFATEAEPNGHIAVNLDIEQIYSSISTQKNVPDAFFLIATRENEILPSKQLPVTLSDSARRQIAPAGHDTVHLDGRRYKIYQSEGSSGFRYLYLVPMDAMFIRIKTIISVSVLIALVGILAPVIASFRLIRSIYSPIESIAQRSKEVSDQTLHEALPENSSHEQIISNTLDRLLAKVDTLQSEITATAEDHRSAFFMQLFFGNSPLPPEQLHAEAQALDIALPYAHYVCALIMLCGDTDPEGEQMPSLCEAVKNYMLQTSTSGCVVQALAYSKSDLCLLINFRDESPANRICDEVHQYLFAMTSCRGVSAISKPYDDLSVTGEHFRRLRNAFQYCFLLPECERFYEEQTVEWSKHIFRANYSDQMAMIRALNIGDEAQANQMLDVIRTQVNAQLWSVTSVRNEIQNIQNHIHEMLDVLLSLNSSSEQPLPVLAKASDAAHIDQAFAILRETIHSFCTLRATQTANAQSTFDIGKVMQYIDERIDQFDVDALTLSGIANHFDKNPNYLSSIFPHYAGMNFKDYVSGKKLEKAAQELRREHAVVRSVANSLGYYNVSNFIKIFKQRYGCTPGIYHERALTELRAAEGSVPAKEEV